MRRARFGTSGCAPSADRPCEELVFYFHVSGDDPSPLKIHRQQLVGSIFSRPPPLLVACSRSSGWSRPPSSASLWTRCVVKLGSISLSPAHEGRRPRYRHLRPPGVPSSTFRSASMLSPCLPSSAFRGRSFDLPLPSRGLQSPCRTAAGFLFFSFFSVFLLEGREDGLFVENFRRVCTQTAKRKSCCPSTKSPSKRVKVAFFGAHPV